MRIRNAIYQFGEISGGGANSNEDLLTRIASVFKEAIGMPMVGMSVFEKGVTSEAAAIWVEGPWETFDRDHFIKQSAWAKDDRVLAKRLEISPQGVVYCRSELMSDSEFQATRLYNEFQRPLGIGDQLMVRYQRHDGVELVITAARELDSGTVTRSVVSQAEQITQYAAQAWASAWNNEPDWLSRLSPTATRVLELVLEGYDDTQISRMLGLTYHSVRAHLKRMFRHAGVRSRLHLMRAIRGSRPCGEIIQCKPTPEPQHM